MSMIADMAGVSKTTVFRALHDRDAVSPETRDRILQVARDLGYRPNLLARSLRRQRSETLGVVCQGVGGQIQGEVIDGVEEVASRHEYAVLVSCSHGDPSREREMVERLLERQADGIIVFTPHVPHNTEFYAALLCQGLPLVFAVPPPTSLPVDSVSLDDFHAGEQAAQILVGAGRSNLVFVGGPIDYSWQQDRLSGFNQVCAHAGLPPTTVLNSDEFEQPDGSYMALRRFLETSPPLDGVFACNDWMAYGVLHALADAGLHVPADVAVIGFDDSRPSAHFRPSLTTFRQPARRMGSTAADLAFRRLGHGSGPWLPQQILLEPILVLRESSGGVGVKT